MAPEVGLWGQVDPKADWDFAYNPYAPMRGNPIMYADPDGDIAPLIILGAMAIGGGLNLWRQWDQVDNFGDGLVAFGIGAAATGVGIGTGGAAAGLVGGAGFGAAVGAGALGGAVSGGSAGLIEGFGNGAYFGRGDLGDRLGQGFSQGLREGGMGALGGAVLGAAGGAIGHGVSNAKWRSPEVPSAGRGVITTGVDDLQRAAYNAAIETGQQSAVWKGQVVIWNGSSYVPYISGTSSLIHAGSTLGKNGLSAFGRALQKHGSRPGSYFPGAQGNTTSINLQGEEAFRRIINNPSVNANTYQHSRFGQVTDFRLDYGTGAGARFTGDGQKFIGFLEPN